MTEHELFSAFVGAAIVAIVGAFVQGWQKRQDAQRTETGKRIGKLEREADFQRGYRTGWRDSERALKRGRNV